jgi:hypothetical protein
VYGYVYAYTSADEYVQECVEHDLEEHSRSRFRRDYRPKVDYMRFAKKVSKRSSRSAE